MTSEQYLNCGSQEISIGGLSFARANYSTHVSFYLKEAASYFKVKTNKSLLLFFFSKAKNLIHTAVDSWLC